MLLLHMKDDYKDTLNLPKTAFPMKANLNQREPEVLRFWKEKDIYKRLQERSRAKTYMLHDGPPYANGHIHIGHALNKILKDIIIKYKSMNGYYAPYVPGWDCHGLPIEHQVDKNLGSKKDSVTVIEKRRLCREYALRFVDIQRAEFMRLGVFGDWMRPYLTMSFPYEASIVREFGRFVKSGYVYKGKKPVHWCPSCVTALAEAEVEYYEKESPSIFVKFKIKDIPGDLKGRFSEYPRIEHCFVAWTTTPWTLVANQALTVHPENQYRLIKANVGNERFEVYIIAAQLMEGCMERFGFKNSLYKQEPDENEYKAVAALNGKELEGIICQHPFIDRESKVITGEHVTMEDGTGVVHTAPGHGEEDYEIGLRYGLDIYAPVDDRGRFTDDVKELSGEHVFKANQRIIDILKDKGALLRSEKITHSYPHCWRCKNPVIFRATEQWFISVEKNALRQRSLAEIEKVNWVPRWGRDRIYGMVEHRPDWCISRQRSWGVPITLFRCKKCKEFVMDEKVMDKIVSEVEKAGADVWFEKTDKEILPDGYRCQRCGGDEFSKETDILDVWFDSGVSHAAVMEDDERLLKGQPEKQSDMYLEGSDQHRGWFQSSLLTSVGTKARAPYKTVLTHGFVVDGQGRKMSKSLGNVIAPDEVIAKHGAEILRLWASAADYKDDIRISSEIIDRLVEAYRKIRNTCRFLLANIEGLDPESRFSKDDLLEIDRFAMSRLQNLIKRIRGSYESASYEFHEIFHCIYNFCVTDMSSFYLDVLKDRLYTYAVDSPERRAAQWVLRRILLALTGMMAPILSFTAEEVWQHMKRPPAESVFLSSFPEVESEFLDDKLEERWKRLIQIRDEVNKAIEIKRQERFLGNSLEAKVTLYISNEYMGLLSPYIANLATLFIVSEAVLSPDGRIPELAYKSEEIEGLGILVEHASGKKCERCWNWSEGVGSFKEHPGLCKKCYEVIEVIRV